MEDGWDMKRRRRPVVGETLYSLNVGNAARRTPQVLTPMLVLSVGRKYFTCAERVDTPKHLHVSFHLDTWFQHSEYSATNDLYETVQEYEDERDHSAICKEVAELFGQWGGAKHIPLEALRQIKAILDANPV